MNEESGASFGDVIREARKKQGWSQGELGEKSGLSRRTIHRPCRGGPRRHNRDHRQDCSGPRLEA